MFVVFETCCSSEKEYLQINFKEEALDKYFTDILRQKPSIFLNVSCRHNNSEGEEVVTFSGSKEFISTSWRGISDRLKLPILSSKVLQIKLLKKFKLADDESHVALKRLKEDYINENRYRDNNIKHSVNMNIAGFKDRLLGFKGKRPFWMNLPFF